MGEGSGSSSISQIAGATTPPTVVSRSAIPIRQVAFATHDLSDTHVLGRVLISMQANITKALQLLGANVTLSGTLMEGLQFNSSQVRYLVHGLGRPWRGYYCVRAQGQVAAFTDVALPPGVTAAQVLPLQSVNQGTYSFFVF